MAAKKSTSSITKAQLEEAQRASAYLRDPAMRLRLSELNGEICESVLNARALVESAGRLVDELLDDLIETAEVDRVLRASRVLVVASDLLHATFQKVNANLRPDALKSIVAEAANG